MGIMNTLSDPVFCEHCGRKNPPRLGPQGRAKRFCSDACRAAASRARRERKRLDELEKARLQSARDACGQDAIAREAAKILRDITAALLSNDRPMVTHAVGDLITAGQELNQTMNAVKATESSTPRPNRAQRRRAKR
ncbi:hypothetical protein FRC0190_00052 [Corynebacterium rouxii]|uniref:FCS-type domain-containing protein n=2 Tax=Corynebacterium rouxii TaxID=2719119 RepID=A0A6I8MEL4_9CORY|nr:hypothetical protein FRC0190_00052 [Corynebacterium rouxii]